MHKRVPYSFMTWSRAIEQETPRQSQGSESMVFQFDNTRNGSSYIASLKAVRALTAPKTHNN